MAALERAVAARNVVAATLPLADVGLLLAGAQQRGVDQVLARQGCALCATHALGNRQPHHAAGGVDAQGLEARRQAFGRAGGPQADGGRTGRKLACAVVVVLHQLQHHPRRAVKLAHGVAQRVGRLAAGAPQHQRDHNGQAQHRHAAQHHQPLEEPAGPRGVGNRLADGGVVGIARNHKGARHGAVQAALAKQRREQAVQQKRHGQREAEGERIFQEVPKRRTRRARPLARVGDHPQAQRPLAERARAQRIHQPRQKQPQGAQRQRGGQQGRGWCAFEGAAGQRPGGQQGCRDGHHGQAIDQRGPQARQHAGEQGRLRVLRVRRWGGGRL